MESASKDRKANRCAGGRGAFRRAWRLRPAGAALLALLFLGPASMWAGQAEGAIPAPTLPQAPEPQPSPPPVPPGAKPCETAATPQFNAQAAPCPPRPETNWFLRYLNGPEVKPLTVAEKGRLAVRNVLDPFNAITILGDAGIAVGSDAHSPYGPGMKGFGKNVGVSFTQDITGEFFGTFLIPSMVHQDPHYHRMPKASIPRRVEHAITQVVWTQGDNGRGMVNYANLVGYAIDDEISNLYVPGRQTNLPASASRYGIGLASAPIDNFVSEFLPDVARHIHIQVVVIQRIINKVAKTDGPGGQ